MINLKRSILMILMIVALGIVEISCRQEDSPSIVVDKYYESLNNGNFERAYHFISKSDQKHRSLSKFQGREDLSSEVKKKFWSLTSWEIKDTKIGTDEAEVSVTLSMPNIGEILGENIGNTLGNLETFGKDKEAIKKMRDGILLSLNSQGLVYKRVNEKLSLVLEEGKWKIFFNWEKEERVRTGILKAIKLRQDGRIDAAINDIKKVLEIDKDNKIAEQYLRMLENEE